MKRDYAVYQVAFKILLRKGNKVLFLKTTGGEYIDLPGGRIDNIESQTPLKKILDREIKEELGVNIKYKLGNPIFQYRRYYKFRKIYIFITIYRAEYLSGNIKLSFEHSSYEWVNPKKYKFKENDFYSKEEYIAFKNHFRSKK